MKPDGNTALFVDHTAWESSGNATDADDAAPRLWVPDSTLLARARSPSCHFCGNALVEFDWFFQAGMHAVDHVEHSSRVCSTCGSWTWTRLCEAYGRVESNVATSVLCEFDISDKSAPLTAVIDWMTGHEDSMFLAHSRVMEKAVGSILRERLGATLEITKETRDGGVDFFGFDSERGQFVVEVKRWKKPVGVSVVRQIAGVLFRERLKTGLLVATAGFSRDARTEAMAFSDRKSPHPIDIELVDVRDLLAWLRLNDSRHRFPSDKEYWREHIRGVLGSPFDEGFRYR